MTRTDWYWQRAEWHGKMAAYCVQLALKLPTFDDATGILLGGTDDVSAMGYIRDAYMHARCAMHFALLLRELSPIAFYGDEQNHWIPFNHNDVGADIPGGGAS